MKMQPEVSIVIPCRNEENYIAACVDSMLQQDYPSIEVLVCDGMSDDGTRNVLEKYSDNPKVRVLDNHARVTPIALNLGIQNAKGDIIIIFGAHATMNVDYVSKSVETFTIDDKIGCVGGVLNQVDENEDAAVISKAMSSVFGVGNAHFRTGTKSGFVDTVAFGAYKKEVFEKVGFFDDELVRNQDDEFNFRVLKGGYKIYLNPEIQADYYVRGNFQKLWRQYYQYGYWKVYVNRKHKTVTTFRQLIPAFMVSCFGVTFLFALIFPIFWNLFLAGTLFYLGAAFYFAQRKVAFSIRIWGVMRSFFVLHFSYGSGYLMGIFDFLILNKKQVNQNAQKLSR
jgi:cellulose synthase/poly-beta-1,6-N-acetylglucosamine synthase-like glycosyltransferase